MKYHCLFYGLIHTQVIFILANFTNTKQKMLFHIFHQLLKDKQKRFSELLIAKILQLYDLTVLLSMTSNLTVSFFLPMKILYENCFLPILCSFQVIKIIFFLF